MKQLPFVIVILFLFISASFSSIATEHNTITKKYIFSPQDIELRDDAFHGRQYLPFTEWWYFDAMFNNGYSAQMSVRILSSLKNGVVMVRLDNYKDGFLLSHTTEVYQLKEILASSEIPLIQIQGKTILVGSIDKSTGNYLYTVSFDFPGNAASLHFVGCTKGWKGQHQAGDWWAVILPRANVTGSITIQNNTMNVTGTGYHDHNWDVSGKASLNFGWFWGKVNSKNYTATWSAILKTRIMRQPIMVVNEKNAGYIPIPSETIWFSAKESHFDHGMFVPYFFNIETMTEKVFLVVNMQVISVQHQRLMGVLNYWRYHVQCTGTIIVDGHAETVDGIFIAEYLRLR